MQVDIDIVCDFSEGQFEIKKIIWLIISDFDFENIQRTAVYFFTSFGFDLQTFVEIFPQVLNWN